MYEEYSISDIEKKEHIFKKMSIFDRFDLHILNTAESVLMAIFSIRKHKTSQDDHLFTP